MGDEKKPWEIGKSFDMSAPIGPIHRVRDVGHFTQGGITLSVNGTVKQNANLSFMIWSVAEQSTRLSQAFELKSGDIIYSGTPENVGPVVRGDVMLGILMGGGYFTEGGLSSRSISLLGLLQAVALSILGRPFRYRPAGEKTSTRSVMIPSVPRSISHWAAHSSLTV